MNDERLVRWGGICGLIGGLIYIGVALTDQFVWPETRTTEEFLALTGRSPYAGANMAMHFAFVAALLLWIVAFLGLGELLGRERPRLSVRLGGLFGVVACSIMTAMVIVQGSVMVKMGQAFVAAPDEAARQSAVAVYRGLRYVDYGLDLAFDVFFFTGWILLANAMRTHKSFGRLWGLIGILLFALDTPVQLWSAPDPPPFDIGPIAALWIAAVYIQMIRSARATPGAA